MTWTWHWYVCHVFFVVVAAVVLFFLSVRVCQFAVLPDFCWQLMITDYSFLNPLITWVWFACSCCYIWSRQNHLTRRDLPAVECWFQLPLRMLRITPQTTYLPSAGSWLAGFWCCQENKWMWISISYTFWSTRIQKRMYISFERITN